MRRRPASRVGRYRRRYRCLVASPPQPHTSPSRMTARLRAHRQHRGTSGTLGTAGNRSAVEARASGRSGRRHSGTPLADRGWRNSSGPGCTPAPAFCTGSVPSYGSNRCSLMAVTGAALVMVFAGVGFGAAVAAWSLGGGFPALIGGGLGIVPAPVRLALVLLTLPVLLMTVHPAPVRGLRQPEQLERSGEQGGERPPAGAGRGEGPRQLIKTVGIDGDDPHEPGVRGGGERRLQGSAVGIVG